MRDDSWSWRSSGLIGAACDAPVDASYLADTVVLLRYFEATGEVKKAISVVKKRSGAHEAAPSARSGSIATASI